MICISHYYLFLYNSLNKMSFIVYNFIFSKKIILQECVERVKEKEG